MTTVQILAVSTPVMAFLFTASLRSSNAVMTAR
jgi:hypothetical protein